MHKGVSFEYACTIPVQIDPSAAVVAGQRLTRDLGAKLKQLEMVQHKLARAEQHANTYQKMAARLDAEIRTIRTRLASLESQYGELTRMIDLMELDGLSPRTLAWLQHLRGKATFGMPEMRAAARAIGWAASDNLIRVTVSTLKRKGFLHSVGRGAYQLSTNMAGRLGQDGRQIAAATP